MSMLYTSNYSSPLGEVLMAADEEGLTGLWFSGQLRFARGLPETARPLETPALSQAKRWLDTYFDRREPSWSVPLHPEGTPFQMAVWALLLEIPYGETRTYGELARALAQRQGLSRMSAQAVGGAVGRNPISILIPCHRCVGANGCLVGYAGGLDKKQALLELEAAGKSASPPEKIP